jgi:hypothetical protein
MRRSSIGVPKVSYYPYEDMNESNNQRSRSTYARYENDTGNSFRLKVSGPNSHRENIIND